MFRILAASLVSISVLMGCASASITPSPSVSPTTATASAEPSISTSPSASPEAALPSPSATPAPTAAPPAATGTLPVRGPGKEIGYTVLTAAGPDGSLFALVPKPLREAVLVRFDRSGRPSPGWPIAMKDVSACRLLLPVEDGSIRLLCFVLDSADTESARFFAFDVQGRSLAGWPVAIRPGSWPSGRVIHDALVLYGGDEAGTRLTIIASDGSIRHGKVVPYDENTGISGDIAPDGSVYNTREASGYPEGSPEISWITAVDLSGVRTGWPVKVDGIASEPAFGPGGRVVLTVGSRMDATSRIVVLDGKGEVLARSAKLPIATAESGVDCVAYSPRSPLAAADGTVFLWSEIDARIFALDPSMKVLPGWPYRPSNGLVGPGWDDPRSELNCSSPAAPAVGPRGTLYLPLQPHDASVGGTLVAVDRNGRVHAGWPITLQRPGAEFLWTVVGSDGTVYALAKEPEAGNSASVTILAIAPDSTVLYRTTIIEP
jgi:hypothetical protein